MECSLFPGYADSIMCVVIVYKLDATKEAPLSLYSFSLGLDCYECGEI